MVDQLQALGAKIAAASAGAVTDVKVAFGELTLTVARERWLDTVKILRDEPDYLFVNIIDVTAADYPEREERFDVVAHLQSPKHNLRIRVKTRTDEDDAGRLAHRALSGRRLVRARDLRSFRRGVFGPSRSAPHHDRLWL